LRWHSLLRDKKRNCASSITFIYNNTARPVRENRPDKIENNKNEITMEKEQATETIQTRVTPTVYNRLRVILERFGNMSDFRFLRMMVDTLIRFTDGLFNLSENLRRIIRNFHDLPGWKKSICLADGIDEDWDVVEEIVVLKQKGRVGERLVWIKRPVLNGDAEGWECTYNVQRILERVIELVNKSLYMHYRRIGASLGTDSVLDTMHTVANMYEPNPDEETLCNIFENNDWERGKKMTQDTIYERRRSHSMDYMETRSLFDEIEPQNEENEDNNN